jgi:hypothetical protein
MVQYAESMQYSEQIRPKDNNKNNSQQQSKRGKKSGIQPLCDVIFDDFGPYYCM